MSIRTTAGGGAAIGGAGGLPQLSSGLGIDLGWLSLLLLLLLLLGLWTYNRFVATAQARPESAA